MVKSKTKESSPAVSTKITRNTDEKKSKRKKSDVINGNLEESANGNSEKSTSQPTLGDLFSKMNKKRKVQNDNEDKTSKTIDEDKKTISNKSSSPKTTTISKRCTECREFLDSPDLKLFNDNPVDAVEEFIMLTDPRLSVHTDGEYDSADVNERPQYKITLFSVYDRFTHLCGFDQGLVEKNVKIYFSGYVKPIYAEDPGPEGGIAARNLGPIVEWFVTGFDGGEKALIGFGTAFAEYILMSPSEEYAPFVNAALEKIYISKAVIEYLCDNEQSTYEDLLNALATTVPPQGVPSFSEDTLLRHAQFVVEQVHSFDSAADEHDTILITSPCMRALISLSGVTLGAKVVNKGSKRKNSG
ncbi:unnamed protein product [Larinioides sclopetarius]|uniref:RFTS domain-containing protein n=1 Tax=Larinioides sclopetarius TaxID=280406 RepID=A0AAV2C0R0_9ARAC